MSGPVLARGTHALQWWRWCRDLKVIARHASRARTGVPFDVSPAWRMARPYLGIDPSSGIWIEKAGPERARGFSSILERDCRDRAGGVGFTCSVHAGSRTRASGLYSVESQLTALLGLQRHPPQRPARSDKDGSPRGPARANPTPPANSSTLHRRRRQRGTEYGISVSESGSVLECSRASHSER